MTPTCSTCSCALATRFDFRRRLAQGGLAASTMAQFAVLHALQIVGEAAARVSDEVRSVHPGIPWAEIVGMRHRIVHDYGRVNMEVVRQVLERDLPALILQLEGLVRTDDEA